MTAEGWRVLSGYGAAVAVLACIICIALLFALRPLLARYALARPNARSSHHTPTPQGAGIAVLAATIFAILAVTAMLGDSATISSLTVVFATAVLIAVAGAIDDIRTIPIIPRLIVQAVAVAIIIAALPAELRIAPMLPWWVERALMLVAGLWFVNLTNFMDGLDWMTVAEVVPVTVSLVIIGALGGLPPHGMVAALALGGAIIGFAPFNRPVARLFLGDVGSLPIGLLLGWLLVLVAARGHAAAALLLPLYYLADATITLAKRIANGEAFWEAHRTHFYQRATSRFSVMQIVARVFAVNVVLGALAIATVASPSPTVQFGALAIGAALVALLLWNFAKGQTPRPDAG